MKVFLVIKEDIVNYPPVLSIIDALLINKVDVFVLGGYSDNDQKNKLMGRGVEFADILPYNGETSLIKKFVQMLDYRHKVEHYLKTCYQEGDIVWIMHAENVLLLNKLINKYKTIVHFFEYVNPQINWKYRLFAPSFDMGAACRNAYKVICCEYNRAHITKGLFMLEDLPIVLPNKFFATDECLQDPPVEIEKLLSDIKNKIFNKKVILYQGVFLDRERRLEEFIQAVNALDDDYVLIAMGRGAEMFNRLKEKYASNKIIFIDFIKPPYHLLITQLADIGILSYFPRPDSVGSVINPLYCAPNKTFEYGRYSIPMLSNDVPALFYQFKEYHCGEIISYPVTPDKIKDKILSIFADVDNYRKGAKTFYDSVDIVEIINEIVK